MKTRRGLLALTSALVASWLCAGCNILGPAMVLIKGPPKTPALYTIPPESRTVIFVDDRASILPRRALRQTVGATAQDTLLSKGSLKTMIETGDILAAAAREPSEQPMDIATLGKTVQADVVIYVSMDRFALSADGATYQPVAEARVKVIRTDAEPARVWPEEREGYPLHVLLPTRTGDIPTTSAAMAKAQDDLAKRLGVSIAKLFYEHETRERLSDDR